uniref:Uncharacterized protein n=1 Tax=Podarcis muralis TaxID=64176 RepID=A0A670JUX3_PODMU
WAPSPAFLPAAFRAERRPAACLQCHPSSRRGARRLPDASPLSHPARESRALGRIQDLEWGSGACEV